MGHMRARREMAACCAATVRTDYGVLSAIPRRRRRPPGSPCRGVRPRSCPQGDRFLSADRLRTARRRCPASTAEAYLAGVPRRLEVAGLRVGRVDFSHQDNEIAETCAEIGSRSCCAPSRRDPGHTGRRPFVLNVLDEHPASRAAGTDESVRRAKRAARSSAFRTRSTQPGGRRRRSDVPRTAPHAADSHQPAHIGINALAGHSRSVTSDVTILVPSVDEGVTLAARATVRKNFAD
jgi:hypothetical protein